jgi:antitoxin component YwqK of YwqJK toxin-antitoxin module
MRNLLLAILSIACVLPLSAQEVKKENLSKQKQTYWDFNKTQIQSSGKYYVDELGETTEKHGKWMYYNKLGDVEEVRMYYRDVVHGPVVLFFGNGEKRQEGYFKLGRQDSVYFEWYETGHPKVEGYYKMNEPVGKWSYYYRDGRLKSVEEVKGEDNYVMEFYLPDSLHTQTIKDGEGELTTYYTTGRVKEWYNYKNGLKNGKFEELSIYGYPTLLGSFKDGEKDGKWEFFYYRGAKEKESTYKEGVLHGPYKYFYDNSQVNVDGRYENGRKEGEWTWYTNKGTRDMQGPFKEGAQHGDWTYWYPTGELSYLAHFDMDKKVGKWTYYYKDGNIFKEGTFADDKKNGMWKTWYEDGTLLMEGEYQDGLENGEWNNYWPEGGLKNKTTFKEGMMNGEWLSYHPDGKSKLTGEYKDNQKVGEWTEYFDNGRTKDIVTYKLFKKKSKIDYSIFKDRMVVVSKKHGHSVSYSDKDYKITEEGDYKEGLKDGEWIAYYPGGKVPVVISNYKDGELNGVMKQYSRRGKLLQEMNYKDGLKHGKFIMYDKRGKVLVERQYSFGMQVIEGTENSPGSFSPGR